MKNNHDLVKLSDPRPEMYVWGEEAIPPPTRGGQGHDTPSMERAGIAAVACIVLAASLWLGLVIWALVWAAK